MMKIAIALFATGQVAIGCGGNQMSKQDRATEDPSDEYEVPAEIGALDWSMVNDTFQFALGRTVEHDAAFHLVSLGAFDADDRYTPLSANATSLPFGTSSIDSIIQIHSNRELYLKVRTEYFLPYDSLHVYLKEGLSYQEVEFVTSEIGSLPHVSQFFLHSIDHPMLLPDGSPRIVRYLSLTLSDQFQNATATDSILNTLNGIPGVDRASIISTRAEFAGQYLLMKVTPANREH